MQTLFVLLFAWAEASIGMKILSVLSGIAFLVLFSGWGGPVLNKITGREEWVGDMWENVGCLTRLIIYVVCIAIILIFLQLDGNYVFWKP